MISLGDNRFFIKTDKYNWILIEKSLWEKGQASLFSKSEATIKVYRGIEAQRKLIKARASINRNIL